LANARAKGKRLGRPVRDPGAQARVVALKGEGLSLRQIAARERLSPSGVRKMLKRAGVEAAAAPAAAPASGRA
jgi:transposase